MAGFWLEKLLTIKMARWTLLVSCQWIRSVSKWQLTAAIKTPLASLFLVSTQSQAACSGTLSKGAFGASQANWCRPLSPTISRYCFGGTRGHIGSLLCPEFLNTENTPGYGQYCVEDGMGYFSGPENIKKFSPVWSKVKIKLGNFMQRWITDVLHDGFKHTIQLCIRQL